MVVAAKNMKRIPNNIYNFTVQRGPMAFMSKGVWTMRLNNAWRAVFKTIRDATVYVGNQVVQVLESFDLVVVIQDVRNDVTNPCIS